MRKILLSCLYSLLAIGLFSGTASAHSVFMKALKAKYEFRTVSCNTCHVPKSDIAEEDLPKYEENSKQFRNEFGKLFLPPLKGKNVDDRAEEASAAKKAAREASSDAEAEKLEAKADEIEAGLSKDFLEALEKVEAMKDKATGKTYAELLKNGEVEGVRLP